jgi:long-subunit acyl-CoA synthetase (AMP-forming)
MNIASTQPVASLLPASIAGARTLPELFRARVALTPEAEAYRQHDESAGAWVAWTWRKIAERVELWRRALAAEQFPAGARVATLMANSVDYVCVDQAALALGLAIVPLHTTDNPGNIAYILEDSEASLLVIDSASSSPRTTAIRPPTRARRAHRHGCRRPRQARRPMSWSRRRRSRRSSIPLARPGDRRA